MLGMYLKRYRLNNNISQKEMAELLHTSQSYYSLLECGIKKPGFRMIHNICELLKISPSEIRNLL